MAQVADFQLIRRLGEGGMGLVFVAQSPRYPAPVALKVLKPDSTEQDLKRFQAEAKAMSRLEHPNLVRIFEHNRSREGHWYMAMELIEGGSLDKRLEDHGPLPPAEAIAMAVSMASALACAHAAGILHRDLKPHNVLIDGAGQAHLSDFGLAKVLDAEALTRPGEVIGTPVYMAPEQALAEGAVDARTDVYGLGATLYHLVTGRRPFEAKGITQLLLKIVKEPPRAPREIRPEIPPGLEAVILRCMSKERAQRYADAGEVQRALEGSLKPAKRGCLKSCPALGGAGLLLALGGWFALA